MCYDRYTGPRGGDFTGQGTNMNAKRFFQAVLPSMLSQLLNGFFIIVDGFFIGGAMGDNGLAAINVAWPVVALILSTGMGLGTGGAVQVAICRGKGDLEGAGRARGNALLAMAAASLILLTALWFSYPVLLPWMGAAGELLPLAEEYLRVVILLGAVQLFSSGLLPLLRGSGRPVGAMAVMVLGLLANIFLDWLFVWVLRWGMVGAAAATVTAQFIGVAAEDAVRAVDTLVGDGTLVRASLAGRDVCYLAELYEAETSVAERLRAMAADSVPPCGAEGIIERIEARRGVKYAPLQREAVALAANSRVMALTGGPGTGKTTSLMGILEAFDSLGLTTLLTAPTGRAAKRMGEVTGREASTIHRLLGAGYLAAVFNYTHRSEHASVKEILQSTTARIYYLKKI